MDTWVYVVIGLVALFTIYFTFSYFAYRKFFMVRTLPEIQFVNHDLDFFRPSHEWYLKAPKEDVSIRAYDGTLLTGIFLPSMDEKSLMTAIVMHGYRSRATDMIVIAKMYNDMGFKVLLVNQRAHGDSEGTFTTFGQYEKLDLKKWILYALRNYGSTDSILLHGASMGAATVLMASALDLPENVKLIVADSSYTNLRSLYLTNAKPKVARLLYPGIDFFTWKKQHFLMGEVSPKKAVVNGRIPIFLWHGKADEMVPYAMAGELLESSKSPFKELYSVEGALHTQSYVVDKHGVEKRLEEIVAKLFPTYKIVKSKKNQNIQTKSAS